MNSNMEKVKKKVKSIYDVRRAQIYGVSLQYAAMALNYFQSQQPARPAGKGKFWHNQTAQAAARVFAEAHRQADTIYWFMAHGVYYGVYLELANDRAHESIRPIVQRYAGRFIRDVKALYVD